MDEDTSIVLSQPTDSFSAKNIEVTDLISVPDVVQLSRILASGPGKKMTHLIRYRHQIVKNSSGYKTIQFLPRDKLPKKACTLESMLSAENNLETNILNQLVDQAPEDKLVWVYKFTKQILKGLQELYEMLEALRKTHKEVALIHGLVRPCSVYRYPNGDIKLTFYGIANTSEADGTYFDLCCLSSIFRTVCDRIAVPAEMPDLFNKTVQSTMKYDVDKRLDTMFTFVDGKLTEHSGYAYHMGPIAPGINISADFKDGATEPAVKDEIEVDELERASVIGYSASSRLRSMHLGESLEFSVVGSDLVTILEEDALIPIKQMNELEQMFRYLSESCINNLFSSSEKCTMTTLFSAQNDRQQTCPYLTYMSILSSRYPLNVVERSLKSGKVFTALLKDEIFTLLRVTPGAPANASDILHEIFTNPKTIDQVLTLALAGTSDSEEYKTMTPTQQIRLFDNLPRFMKMILQTPAIAMRILVTQPDVNNNKESRARIWSIIRQGIERYRKFIESANQINTSTVQRNTSTQTVMSSTSSPQSSYTTKELLSSMISSCTACLRSYMHLVIVPKQQTFTKQIEENEECMAAVLNLTRLSAFENTFHIYFRGRFCSHNLINRMVYLMCKKDHTGAFGCSIIDTICISELLIIYLTNNGIANFTKDSIDTLLSSLIDLFRIPIENPDTWPVSEFRKASALTKVIVNYFVIRTSHLAIKLLNGVSDAARGIADTMELMSKLCADLGKVFVQVVCTSGESGTVSEKSAPSTMCIYNALDCLARIIHFIGGVEHIVVKNLEGIHTGDEYAQICKAIGAREEPLFLNYSDLPSTSMQGIGGPAIWRSQQNHKNRKKLIHIYVGVLSLLNTDLTTFLCKVSKLPSLENASMIHVRLGIIHNIIVETVHLVLKHDAQKLSEEHIRVIRAMEIKANIRDGVTDYLKEMQKQVQSNPSSPESTAPDTLGTIKDKSANKLELYHLLCTIRRMIELCLDVDEVHVFHLRHILCANQLQRDDMSVDKTEDLELWSKTTFIEQLKLLGTNIIFKALISVFDLPFDLILIAVKCDTFYRD